MKPRVTIKWNDRSLSKVAEEAGRRAMEIASEAASQVRCLDHGEIVRVLDRDPKTGGFKLRACCEPAKRTALEAIEGAFR